MTVKQHSDNLPSAPIINSVFLLVSGTPKQNQSESDGCALPVFPHLAHHRHHHHQLLPPQTLDFQLSTSSSYFNSLHHLFPCSSSNNHMASATAFSASSNLTTLLPNQTPPSNSLFLGSRSIMNFGDVQERKRCNDSFFRAYDENDDEYMEEYFHQPEKKRRLSTEQVQFLEKSFDEENKLEPDRKVRLAKELGLQPRQVAIWFQNRRARWKTKQLEKDYDSLQASYTHLKANYDNLLREKDKLQDEVARLTEKVLGREKNMGNFEQAETNGLQEPLQKSLIDSASEGEGSKVSIGACKQEDISSAKSDMFDSSESPHYTDGVHSALLETGDSSYVFEADQSDVSQDEEDNLSKTLFPPYIFPKLEDVDYSDPPNSSCHFGIPEEDHAIWSWSY